MRSHFEQEQGVGSRLIKQGDVVAVPISEEIKENDDDEEDRLPRWVLAMYLASSVEAHSLLGPGT